MILLRNISFTRCENMYPASLPALSDLLITSASSPDKNKFENRFSKSKTGFRFSNRKQDFRFSINIPTVAQFEYHKHITCNQLTTIFNLMSPSSLLRCSSNHHTDFPTMVIQKLTVL